MGIYVGKRDHETYLYILPMHSFGPIIDTLIGIIRRLKAVVQNDRFTRDVDVGHNPVVLAVVDWDNEPGGCLCIFQAR